jgi:hypothetical protein
MDAMVGCRRARLLIGLIGLIGLLIDRPANAEETRPRTEGIRLANVTSAPPPDSTFLDALAKDLGLTLSGGSEPGLTLGLAPGQWSLGGLRPYAALSPRVLRWVGDGMNGLAAPDYESQTDLSHGVGVGVGLQWKLSDHLDLFGQYMLRPTPRAGNIMETPTLKPDLQSPGLTGGFSIRF